MATLGPPIQLHGFNNLTKSLSFGLYQVTLATNDTALAAYQEHIAHEHAIGRMQALLQTICEQIGASVLALTSQAYQPQGASLTMMICEGPLDPRTPPPELLLAHLDKSHICIHTYPELQPQDGVHVFRSDLEVSTCGEISPLACLPTVLQHFDADVIAIDYRVRGFNRGCDGQRQWLDHPFAGIVDAIDPAVRLPYDYREFNLPDDRSWSCRLQQKRATDAPVAREMEAIFQQR